MVQRRPKNESKEKNISPRPTVFICSGRVMRFAKRNTPNIYVNICYHKHTHVYIYLYRFTGFLSCSINK